MGHYKNQHTVTEAYLRGFTSSNTPNTLWRFDKTNGDCRRSNVDRATVKFYAYSFRKPDGQWNHEIEQLLGDVESYAIPLLPKLEAGKKLEEDERDLIAMFIAVMVRRPVSFLDYFQSTFLKYANDPVRTLAFFQSLLPELIEKFDEDEIEDVRSAIERGVLNIDPDAGKAMQMREWFTMVPKQSEMIAGMHWQIWRADSDNEFLTSDSPAYFRRGGHYDDSQFAALGQSDTELFFPISHKSFLVAKHRPCKDVMKATKTRVRELNALTIRMGHRYIFALQDSEPLRSLVNRNRRFTQPLPDFTSPIKEIDEEMKRKGTGANSNRIACGH